jgi:RNA polymerase sigma-70 factor (ECF subfamily)
VGLLRNVFPAGILLLPPAQEGPARIVDVHRFHLGTKMRDAGQEVSLHGGPLPQVTSLSLAEQLLGKLTTAGHAAMRVELKLRVQEALNSMAPHDREVLALRHFEEQSNAETVQVLGIRAAAAVNRYVRALERAHGGNLG